MKMHDMRNVRYVLASKSPRRKELLHQAGIEFEIIPSDADESTDKTEPSDIVLELSRNKCDAVVKKLNGDGGADVTVVIAADTVVTHDGVVLGKPGDAWDAVSILAGLSGKTHLVCTGVSVCVYYVNSNRTEEFSFTEETRVKMYPFSIKEAEEYVDTGEPMDKAGAYGIQGRGALLVERIEGDYNNVVGLPLAKLCRELRERGLF